MDFGLLLCHWLPCRILLRRKFLICPQEKDQYFQRTPAEVSMCTVGCTATDCSGSFRGEKSFQILGSQDLNSSTASLVIAVGSSRKADTAVWHLIIRLPIVSLEECWRGSRGKKKKPSSFSSSSLFICPPLSPLSPPAFQPHHSPAAYSEDGLTDADFADAGESPPSALEWAEEQLIVRDPAVKDTRFCRIRPRWKLQRRT